MVAELLPFKLPNFVLDQDLSLSLFNLIAPVTLRPLADHSLHLLHALVPSLLFIGVFRCG